MEVILKGDPKEIAALVVAIQERQGASDVDVSNDRADETAEEILCAMGDAKIRCTDDGVYIKVF